MKVSIVIPIYNVEPYIERCIKSVMMQEYPDIECILVDDGSPDHSLDVCERLISNYNGPIEFRILKHDHNRGLSAARNTGTDAASGEYIFYLDSDDEITPDCISLMVAETKKHPEVTIVSGAVDSIPYAKQYDSPYYATYKHLNNNYSIRATFFAYDWPIYVMAWNKLIKREFLSSNNIHFIEGILNEDEVWTFITISECQSMSVLPNKTYIHYDTAGSIMNSFKYSSRCEAICIVLDHIVPLIRQPLALLQTLRYTQYLLLAYYGVRRQRHMFITRRLSRLLAIYGAPLLSFELLFFMRFNATFHLHRYEEKIVNRVNTIYQKTTISAQKKIHIPLGQTTTTLFRTINLTP